MLTDRHFPYSSMQEINLDWILTKVKNILRFVPDDGSVGQILRRTAHGAEWSNEQGGGGSVNSVNGQTGDVVLDAADVGALPDSTVIPTDTADLTNSAGFVDAAGAAAAAPVQKVNGQTGTVTINKTSVGLGNVQNVLQYSASNPPPYPVTSVNGQTGAVVLDADDVGALPDSYVAPVTSVNTMVGAVTITKSIIGLSNVANVLQYSASNPPPYPVTSVNGQTGAVTIPTPPTSWTILGTATGTTAISLGSLLDNYTTIYVQVYYSGYVMPIMIPASAFANSARTMAVSYSTTVNVPYWGAIQYSKTLIKISSMYDQANNDITASCQLDVLGI